MVERFAANMLAKSGDEPAHSGDDRRPRSATTPPNAWSSRSNRRCRCSTARKLIAEFERQFPATNYIDSETVHRLIRHSIEVNAKRWTASMKSIMDPERTKKSRMQDIRSMRNYYVHFNGPRTAGYLAARATIRKFSRPLEAFGWFTLSVRRDEIARTALDMSRDESLAPAVLQRGAENL